MVTMRAFGGRQDGFTLIELWVVIAIIAILAAILFPVFARAREKAIQSSCLSNVKQLGTATQMYAQDYDETLPFCRMDLAGTVTGTYAARHFYEDPDREMGWMVYAGQIMPYAKNDQLFKCPSNKRVWIGYGWNIECGYRNHFSGRTGPMYEGVMLSDFNRPAEFVMLADCNDRGGFSTVYWNGLWTNPDHHVYDDAWPATHNDGVNVAYVDGHAKWQTRNAFMAVEYGGSSYWFLGSDE